MRDARGLPWHAILRAFFIALASIALFSLAARGLYSDEQPLDRGAELPPAPQATSSFIYTFDSPGILHETNSPDSSSSPYWWLDSGGKLLVHDGVGSTLQGSLTESDAWFSRYQASSSRDTDNGAHPQNLFRLVTKSRWNNVSLAVSFRILKDNFSTSPNRNESNGLLLMSRYQDRGDTIYYAGLRVDGHAVIKKKYQGTYYTMAETSVFRGIYDRDKNTNLLPHNEWITLRMTTETTGDIVRITLSIKEGENWTELLSAEDDGVKFSDTPTIVGESPVGIRTDFMDVEFDDIEIHEL